MNAFTYGAQNAELALQSEDYFLWDCAVTTNPTVAILPNGETFIVAQKMLKA